MEFNSRVAPPQAPRMALHTPPMGMLALSIFAHSKFEPQFLLREKYERHPPYASEMAPPSQDGVWTLGANRDICSEYDLYGSEPTPKEIRIGEAGKGHAFMSKAEGVIKLTVKGKELPLLPG